MEHTTDLTESINRGTEIYLDAKQRRKEANQLIKQTAKEVNCEPRQISKCYWMLYTCGNGWVENNPLTIDKEFCKNENIKPDIISKAFMKIAEIFDIFSACGIESELEPYVKALNEHLGLQLDWNINKNTETGKKIKNSVEMISEIYKKIDDIGESMQVLSSEAEENGVATKSLFPKLVDWKYKLENSNENTVKKVEDQIGNYRLNLNLNLEGISIFNK